MCWRWILKDKQVVKVVAEVEDDVGGGGGGRRRRVTVQVEDIAGEPLRCDSVKLRERAVNVNSSQSREVVKTGYPFRWDRVIK